MSRVEQEIELVRAHYPDLEVLPDRTWARIPRYEIPADLWRQQVVEAAFQFPPELPGQQPYGFWVRPNLELRSGSPVNNVTYPVATPFGDGWAQFSWAPESWEPRAELLCGTNMLDFVRSIGRRLSEGA